MKKSLSLSFDEALRAVPEALAREGFGILTEIDVAATLKKKLDVDFRRYKILGACNPAMAHRALSTEVDAGVMLPCNAVIYETDDKRANVVFVDPMQTFAAEHPKLSAVADEVRQKLAAALASLPAK